MARDKRYDNINKLIAGGHITAFRQIFELEVIPKSVVARDLGMNNVRFSKLMLNVDQFTYEESFAMARLIDISEAAMTSLIVEQYLLDQKTKKKKSK